MKIVVIIPARYASTRFPGKPLVEIDGKPMVQRVYEQAKTSSVDQVVVATDDERIKDCVVGFGGEVVMTSADHPNGTCRCEEVLNKLEDEIDAVINVQGDEPFIDPSQINQIAELLNEEASIATLIKEIGDDDTLFDINKPKVVKSATDSALYFSRQTIPCLRDVPKGEWRNHHTFYKHIGIYGYQASVLKEIVKLEPGVLEEMEKLEQLRWLENGYDIKVAKTEFESIGIDTPEDLKKLGV